MAHEYQKIFCAHTCYYKKSDGGVFLALSSFLNVIPNKKKPEISVGIFIPTT